MTAVKKLLNKIFEAYNKKQIEKSISLAEKAEYFLVAGDIAKKQGLFNKAFELYKKGKEKNDYDCQQGCLNNFNELSKIITAKEVLTIKKIQKHEEVYNNRVLKIYQERYDYGKWNNAMFGKTADSNLTISVKNYNRLN